ncbi:MAG: hypothetical protein HGA52_09065, partial [Bacteroidales bacterium]|nr:hypothetical protein [Bacteroidales bacterium]
TIGGTLFDEEDLEKVEITATASTEEKRVKKERVAGKTMFNGLRAQMRTFFDTGDNEA